MLIIHRISINSTPTIRSELAKFGVVVGDTGFVTFEVSEDHKAWDQVHAWIARRRAPDIVTTRFSKKEIDAARWLCLVPDWHWSYPQPNELDFGYLSVTYDVTDYCRDCGIGLRQQEPFQMKGEPKWGRNGILQLNWVFDEYFVTPEVWATVFKPNDIPCRIVTNTKGKELKTVVQLLLERDVHIMTKDLEGEKCAACKRVKYLPVTRGMFKALAGEPPASVVKTVEYFGSGASAYRQVLLSRTVAQALENARGASVCPVTELEIGLFGCTGVRGPIAQLARL